MVDKKARQSWNGIAPILKGEGSNTLNMAKLYIPVVQSVLPYEKTRGKLIIGNGNV